MAHVPTVRVHRGFAQPQASDLDMCMSCGTFTEYRGGDHLCRECREASVRREEGLKLEDQRRDMEDKE